MDRDELLARYEATGGEQDFLEAKSLYEKALTESPDDSQLHLKYGYLLECHSRSQLRHAVAQYERAIQLDPSNTKAHYQLIAARAGLLEPDQPISVYEHRLAGAPRDLDAHRLLAAAYLAGRQYAKAQRVIDDGLALAPDDATLIENRGDVRAGTGDPDGALADWRRALKLNPENLSSVYSSAFLLERQGRMLEAMDAWRYIIDWSEARGFSLETEWPKRELQRLGASQPGREPERS
jgi:tetratricopeptide (TPR) repeat protein